MFNCAEKEWTMYKYGEGMNHVQLYGEGMNHVQVWRRNKPCSKGMNHVQLYGEGMNLVQVWRRNVPCTSMEKEWTMYKYGEGINHDQVWIWFEVKYHELYYIMVEIKGLKSVTCCWQPLTQNIIVFFWLNSNENDRFKLSWSF